MRQVALYARVSTTDQTCENQLVELHAIAERQGWEIVQEFVDHGISGAKGKEDRPQFAAIHQGITRRDFDLVAVWSVDRLGRSLKDLVEFLSHLQAKGVGLYLHQQGLDTTTPAGRALFGMMGVFAEFERAMIQERVRAGIASARRRGQHLGRPALSHTASGQRTIAKVHALRKDGLSMCKIAKEVGISSRTVMKLVASATASEAKLARSSVS